MGKRRDGLAAFFALVFGYTSGLAALYALFPGALGIVSSSTTSVSGSMLCSCSTHAEENQEERRRSW